MKFYLFKHKIKRILYLKRNPLVNVCAWCPKEFYPQLKAGQEYTHGLCNTHYRKITTRKKKPINVLFMSIRQHGFRF